MGVICIGPNFEFSPKDQWKVDVNALHTGKLQKTLLRRAYKAY